MAVVPVIITGVAYPKNKKDPPLPCTFVGNAAIAGLEVDNEPPPDIKPEPPLVIWGPGGPWIGVGPIIPPEPPPEKPPSPPVPPHEGWNWSDAKSGWYYLYVPGKEGTGPKR